MKPLAQFADVHSHDPAAARRGDTVVSIAPGQPMLPGGAYSVGIHPWDAADGPVPLAVLKQLVADARDPRVAAIGECGFDRLRGGDIHRQTALFDFHARLARQLGKPMIIHAVRADDLLLAAARRHRPAPGQWIVHGFRGKPQAARQLLDAGFSLSLGRKYNPETLKVIPTDRLYRESDFQPTAFG